MAYKIVNRLILGKEIKRLDIEAPAIARSFRPGQFVMIAPDEGGKWVALTIVESDTRRGIISIIFKESGSATRMLGGLSIQDEIFAVSGPFGFIREVKQLGVVVCVAEDVSAAQILPMCRAYNRAGNKVIGVLGAKSKSELILEPQMRIACHKVVLTTADGSYQRRGSTVEVVRELFEREDVQLVYSVGSVPMMREIARMTSQRQVRNLLQVHTVMSCGRGICGSCRVKVNNQLALACEEGPEFNAHEVDFDYLERRMEHVCSHDPQGTVTAKAEGLFKKFLQPE
ncbi:MAG TPA: sulfide/dihydroorotate dehydrogenase-like FAD/NAD-binding protein [Candidatus Bathyarchaeia archaeon]|nr:sulfide/dihydroorotate dehydrogenase-like FAD/NAD-binding protein [Candidatus Bathyarchaeia archaeon]